MNMADHRNQNDETRGGDRANAAQTGVQMLGPTLWLMVLICLISIGLSLWAAGAVDEDARIAIQWNAQGPTNTVSKPLGLILLPAIQVAFLLLGIIIPSISPRRGHLLQSRKAYRTVWLTVMAVLTLGHALSVVGAAGYAVPVERIILTATTLLLAIIGNVITKVRSNYFLGVRTPWTLSSEYAWRKTHKLIGILMVVCGLGLFVMGLFVPLGVVGGALTAAVLLIAVTAFVYSYMAWRADKRGNGSGHKKKE